MSIDSSRGAVGAAFRTTHWSVVLRAQDANQANSRESLAALCEQYWYPVYAFIRHKGKKHHEAQDLAQDFFARFIEKEFIAAVDREKGRFRAFLRTTVDRFLCTQWERSQAQKRGGGAVMVTWDAQSAEDRFRLEPTHDSSPEKLFDRNWASALLARATEDLKSEYARAGKAELLEVLQACIGRDAAHGSYSAVAERLGMTEGNARQWAHRIRQRYGQLIRERIAETVDSEGAVEEELRSLYAALGGG